MKDLYELQKERDHQERHLVYLYKSYKPDGRQVQGAERHYKSLQSQIEEKLNEHKPSKSPFRKRRI